MFGSGSLNNKDRFIMFIREETLHQSLLLKLWVVKRKCQVKRQASSGKGGLICSDLVDNFLDIDEIPGENWCKASKPFKIIQPDSFKSLAGASESGCVK